MQDNSLYNKPTLEELALEHFGIKGMKWGVRRDRDHRHSTSLAGRKARKANQAVDQSFKEWNQKQNNRSNAIEVGKRRNEAQMKYENTKNRQDRKAAKSANREYKKALKSNTTYHQGQVRQEVGRDLSRKYYSKAKDVKKQLDADPTNRKLAKQYDKLMDRYDVERANARDAPAKYAAKSQRKANLKRAANLAADAALTVSLIYAGKTLAKQFLGVDLNYSQMARSVAIAQMLL